MHPIQRCEQKCPEILDVKPNWFMFELCGQYHKQIFAFEQWGQDNCFEYHKPEDRKGKKLPKIRHRPLKAWNKMDSVFIYFP